MKMEGLFTPRAHLTGKKPETFFLSSSMSVGSIYSYLSGISRQITRLLTKQEGNFLDNFFLWTFSITKIISAHSINSGVRKVSAVFSSPAEFVCTPGHLEKIFSAVGLRSRFWLQINKTFFISDWEESYL